MILHSQTHPLQHINIFTFLCPAALSTVLTTILPNPAPIRLTVWLLIVATPLAFWLGQGWVQIALLLGSLILVLIVELLNSGIEAAIDRVSFELHDLSKRAKDLASAAVMLSLLLSAGIWGAALWQRLLHS